MNSNAVRNHFINQINKKEEKEEKRINMSIDKNTPTNITKIEPTKKKKKSKCQICKRKLKLFEVEFKCECELQFCCKHQLPFNHNCNFQEQRQENNKDLLREKNKLIMNDKVVKF